MLSPRFLDLYYILNKYAAPQAPSIKDERGRTIVRLSMGVLLHTLVSNMEEATAAASTRNVKKAPKMYLYSGHDR